MRLTRLNWAVRLLRPTSAGSPFPWYYHEMRYTTTDWVRDYGAGFLFIFASLSLFLAALQVKATIGMSFIRQMLSSLFAEIVCYYLVGMYGVGVFLIVVVWSAQCCYACKSRRPIKKEPANMV
jgi:hypothetical protein